MIVDIEDVKLLYKQHGIKINLTDEELEKVIQFQLDGILGELGVTLEPQEHNYTVYQHPPKKPVVLPLNHILGVEHVVVNGKPLCHHEYFLDELNGIVHIIKDYGCCPLSFVHVKYITVVSDIFLEKLKSLLMDMLLIVATSDDDEKGIKSITEGDVTVTYDSEWNIYYHTAKAIPLKFAELKKLLYNDTAFIL